MAAPQPFRIYFPDDELVRLRTRVEQARWPAPSDNDSWKLGTSQRYLKTLCSYWLDDFDWRAQEERLNRFQHFTMKIDGAVVHYVHARAPGGEGLPLILGHGWPSSFVEYLPLVPLLTDPTAHGLDGPSFDVVIPSLPGYGFSERPPGRVWNYANTAALWHKLMLELGYGRYGAGGSDFGSGIATMMALQEPDSLLGLHLSNIDIDPVPDPAKPLSAAEQQYLANKAAWWESESGYREIQGTKPATLAFALNDSPVGLAAWIVEKWISWGDPPGDINHFSKDDLLTTISLYWLTGTVGSSILDYADNRTQPPRLGVGQRVTVPAGIAVFNDPAGNPPVEWMERLYKGPSVTDMPTGGHFAGIEEPQLLAADITRFFKTLSD